MMARRPADDVRLQAVEQMLQQIISNKQSGSKSYTTSRNVSAVMFSRSTPTTTFGIPQVASTQGSGSCDTGDDCEIVGDGETVNLGEWLGGTDLIRSLALT